MGSAITLAWKRLEEGTFLSYKTDSLAVGLVVVVDEVYSVCYARRKQWSHRSCQMELSSVCYDIYGDMM